MEKFCTDISIILRVPPQFRTHAHIENLISLTKEVQFFQKITSEQSSSEIHRECCKVMDLEEYQEDDIIFNFGDKGDKFYIILSGSVSIKIPSKKKVIVSKDMVNKIEKMLESDEDSVKSDSSIEEIYSHTKKSREGPVKVNILDVMSSINQSKYMKESDIDEKQCILDNEEKNLLSVFKNKVIKEQKILMNFVKQAERDNVEIELEDLNEIGILNTGSAFGELALISDRARSATIQTREKSSFLVLNKNDFTKILGGIAEKRLNVIIKYMHGLIYFKSWSRVSLVRLAYFFQSKKIIKSQYLYREGDPVDGIYFIKDGEITITKKKIVREKSKDSIFPSSSSGFLSRLKKKKMKKTLEIKVIIKGSHESLGGKELFDEKSYREYSCICNSPSADLYFMPKSPFLTRVPNMDVIKELLINEHERIIERYEEMCGVNENLVNSQELRSYTPTINTAKTNKTSVESLIRSVSKERNFVYGSRKSTPNFKNARPTFLRKLTDQEVNDAINGRSPLIRKYANRIKIEQNPALMANQILRRSRKNLFTFNKKKTVL